MVYTVTHKAFVLSGQVLLEVITLYTRYGWMSLFLYNILYLLNYSIEVIFRFHDVFELTKEILFINDEAAEEERR